MIPPLRPYQQDALGFTLTRPQAYLALEAVKALGSKRVLVIAPKVALPVWVEETRRWMNKRMKIWRPSGKEQFFHDPLLLLCVNYDRFSGKIAHDNIMRILNSPRFDMLILDEAHWLKDFGAQRTKNILQQVAPHCDRAILLSGTPAPNHAGELYPALRTFYPKSIKMAAGGVLTQFQYENLFCRVGMQRIGARQVRVIQGSKNLDTLRQRLEGFLLRRTKKSCLPELPPLQVVTTPVEIDIDDVRQLKQLQPLIDENMTDDELLDLLEQPQFATARRFLGLAKAPVAAEIVHSFLVDNPQRKCLVWAHHREVITKLASQLANYRPAVIMGGMSTEEREEASNAFNRDPHCRVFIGSVMAAGTALTLLPIGDMTCSDEFVVEAVSTPGHLAQALARCHRLGQREGVLAQILHATGTVDDRIARLLASRTEEIEELLDKESA